MRHLRFECIHIEKPVIEPDRWEFCRRRQHRIRIPLDIPQSRAPEETGLTYLFAVNPTDLVLEHGRKPLIGKSVHGVNLHDPIASLLPVVGFIGKLRLTLIRNEVEF